MRWEHRVIHVNYEERLQEEIHKLEVLGWELVSAVGFERHGSYHDYRSFTTLFFKRKVEDDSMGA